MYWNCCGSTVVFLKCTEKGTKVLNFSTLIQYNTIQSCSFSLCFSLWPTIYLFIPLAFPLTFPLSMSLSLLLFAILVINLLNLCNCNCILHRQSKGCCCCRPFVNVQFNGVHTGNIFQGIITTDAHYRLPFIDCIIAEPYHLPW